MTGSVAIPVWLLILVSILAAVAALDRIIGPGLRWFFRRRVEHAVARLNQRLERKIEPFRLAARADLVARLAYDPKVMEAVAEHAAETGVPGEVAFAEARRYAREIVPGFSALLYFGIATRLARWLSRLFYRVRVGGVAAELGHLDGKATIVFVMNHRSNMDYVLVTWLVAQRSALSYAVGEWARIWPLSSLIRAMGAFFIRRNSRNALYRRVLARYVQMATTDGVTQAMFPEGGLSLDGRVGPARLGLLSYIVQGFDPTGRDVVFVPVGLAYDRVMEDRILVAAAAAGTRRFHARWGPAAVFLVKMAWQKARGRFPLLGTAAASFGPPLSLRAFLANAPDGSVEALGAALTDRILRAIPLTPVPLVAHALSAGPLSRTALISKVENGSLALKSLGASLRLHPLGPVATTGEALDALLARGIVREAEGVLCPADPALLAFYAAPVTQLMEAYGAAMRQT
jgi:glycerol-3-phosphate O-acyltransferase